MKRIYSKYILKNKQYSKNRLFTTFETNQEIVDSCKKYTMWSWSAQAHVDPLVMTKAEGIYFWDANNTKYIDLNSQLMCVNIGHQHPKVIEAIKKQCDELIIMF